MSVPILLTNPRAGLGERQLAFRGERFVLGSGPLPDLSHFSLLVLAGGDGTLQRTLTEALEQTPASALPPIAVLPAGRTNMTAADLNRHRRFGHCAKTLEAMLDGALPPATARPLVRVDQSDDRQYGWFFGIGAVCFGVAHWNSDRPGSQLGTTLRTAWSSARGYLAPSEHQTVRWNGQTRQVFAMIATSLNRLLFGCRPYWGDGEGMHNTWVFAEAQGRVRRSLRLLRGDASLGRLPGYASSNRTDLELELDGPYVIDGELFDNRGPLRLSLSEPLQWLAL